MNAQQQNASSKKAGAPQWGLLRCLTWGNSSRAVGRAGEGEANSAPGSREFLTQFLRKQNKTTPPQHEKPQYTQESKANSKGFQAGGSIQRNPPEGQSSTWQCRHSTQECWGAFADCFPQASPHLSENIGGWGWMEERPGSEHQGRQQETEPLHLPGARLGGKQPSSPGAMPRLAWSLGQGGHSHCGDEMPQRT